MMPNLRARAEAAEHRMSGPLTGDAETEPAEMMTPDEMTIALRSYFHAGTLAMTPDAVTIGPGVPDASAGVIAEALTREMAAEPGAMLVLLTPAEVERALSAIDAGDWFMTWCTRGSGARCDFRPWPAWRLPQPEYSAAAELCSAVNLACRVAAARAGQPLRYDVSGDLADVRAWLAWFDSLYTGERRESERHSA